MNVWLVSPAWSRYSVTDLCLAQRRWLCDELAARGIDANSVIVTDDENADIAREYDFDVLEFPNDRGLGARFNAGFEYAFNQGADYIVHIGSDDWVHPDWFGPLPGLEQLALPFTAEQMEAAGGEALVMNIGPRILTAGQIDIIHLSSGLGMTFMKRRQWGIVPWALPRRLFEEKGFELVEPGIPKGVEGSMAGRMGGVAFVHHDLPHVCVDFKTDENVTSFERLWKLPGHPELPDPFATLREFYPAELVEKAEALSEELIAV